MVVPGDVVHSVVHRDAHGHSGRHHRSHFDLDAQQPHRAEHGNAGEHVRQHCHNPRLAARDPRSAIVGSTSDCSEFPAAPNRPSSAPARFRSPGMPSKAVDQILQHLLLGLLHQRNAAGEHGPRSGMCGLGAGQHGIDLPLDILQDGLIIHPFSSGDPSGNPPPLLARRCNTMGVRFSTGVDQAQVTEGNEVAEVQGKMPVESFGASTLEGLNPRYFAARKGCKRQGGDRCIDSFHTAHRLFNLPHHLQSVQSRRFGRI